MLGKNGGVFRATEGLQEKFGEDRVFDTPLAESGIAGLSFGLALEGFRPVPEIQFFGFIFEAMDEVVAQMARTRYRMSGVLEIYQSRSVHHLVAVFIHQNCIQII